MTPTAEAQFVKLLSETGDLLTAATLRIKDGSVRPQHCRSLLSLVRQRARIGHQFCLYKKGEDVDDAGDLPAQLKVLAVKIRAETAVRRP